MADTELAPAKLTLSLRITGVRADGYHLIDAEMVTIDLFDTLVFTEGDGLALVNASDDVPLGDSNLVERALRKAGRVAHVELTKGIPSGAGLGGGSADAAAVLRWARVDDLDMAARLGADVPFCLGGGRARVRGIGDQVEPLPFQSRTFTLLTPPLRCATAEVYRAWDALPRTTVEASAAGGSHAGGANDLEPAALRVEPELARWRDRLGDATGQVPSLAGSGSTWFVEGAHEGDGFVVAQTVPARSTG